MLYLSEAQKAQLVDNEPTEAALETYWRFYPDLNFDAAVGGAINLLVSGWVRNEHVEAPGAPSEDFLAATTKPAEEGVNTAEPAGSEEAGASTPEEGGEEVKPDAES